MLHYFFVLLSVFCLAVNFSINKIYQNRVGTESRMVVIFNIVSSALTILLFFGINGLMNGFDSFHITPFSLVLALAMAAFVGGYSLIGFRIIALGNIAVYTLFLMLGGMMLPYFFGLIFLEESFSLLRLAGLLIMVLSIILSGLDDNRGDAAATADKKRNASLFFLLCITVFFLNGLTSITTKVHQLPQYADLATTSQLFVMLTATFRLIFFSGVYAVMRIRQRHIPIEARSAPLRPTFPVISLMLLSAAIEGAAFLLQLISASHLPATVLYPLITGGVIILTAIAGRVLFSQRLSRRATLGILLCFASTFLFL